MSEANKSFTKVIIISVIMVLIIAGLLYLLPMAFKNESSSPIINVNPIDKRMDKINNKKEENEIDEIALEEGIMIDNARPVGEEGNTEEEMNKKRESFIYRRYLESSVKLCESEEFVLHCEDFEFEFSDETGCGCELTEERIVEEEKMRIEENGMIEDIIEE